MSAPTPHARTGGQNEITIHLHFVNLFQIKRVLAYNVSKVFAKLPFNLLLLSIRWHSISASCARNICSGHKDSVCGAFLYPASLEPALLYCIPEPDQESLLHQNMQITDLLFDTNRWGQTKLTALRVGWNKNRKKFVGHYKNQHFQNCVQATVAVFGQYTNSSFTTDTILLQKLSAVPGVYRR